MSYRQNNPHDISLNRIIYMREQELLKYERKI